MWNFAASDWVALEGVDVIDRTPVPPVPGVVRGVSAQVEAGRVVVSWQPPLNNGAASSRYVVEYRVVGSDQWQSVESCQSLTQTSCSHGGVLPWGEELEYRVVASNSQGSSEVRVSSVTPRHVPNPVPVAGDVAVVAGDRSITVSWSDTQFDAPEVTRGSPVTWVRVRAVPVSSGVPVFGPWVDIRPTRSGSSVIDGLDHRLSYRVEMQLWNFAASDWVVLTSGGVVEFLPPDPTVVTQGVSAPQVVAGDRSITVSWSDTQFDAPEVTRGSPVTWVQVRAVSEVTGRVVESPWVDIRQRRSGSSVIGGLVNDETYRVEMRLWNFAASDWVALEGKQLVPRPDGAPLFLAEPELVGSLELGGFLTLYPGQITGSPAPNLAIAWFRCFHEPVSAPSEDGNCQEVSSTATESLSSLDSPRYQFVQEDVGLFIVAQISASNSLGVTRAFTTSESKVSSRPVLDLNRIRWVPEYPLVGRHNLQAALGQTWTAYPTLESDSVTHQWLRCDEAIEVPLSAVPNHCTSLDMVTGLFSSITISPEDAGKYITTLVTATNEIGTTSIVIPRTVPVSSDIQMIESPELFGELIAPHEPTEQRQLVVNPGSWAGSPQPITRVDWVACSSETIEGGIVDNLPEGCHIIASNQEAYNLSRSIRGGLISAIVTASNPGATMRYLIPQANRISFQPIPENLFLTISGDVSSIGAQLALSDPRWTGLPTVDVTHSWYRCEFSVSSGLHEDVPDGCELIESASSSRTYRTQLDDRHYWILATTIATNEIGTTGPLRTATVGPIGGVAPQS